MRLEDIHLLSKPYELYLDVADEDGEQKLNVNSRSTNWLGWGLKKLGFPVTNTLTKVTEYLKQNPLLPYVASEETFEKAEEGLVTLRSHLSNSEEIKSIEYVISRLSEQKSHVVNGKRAYAELKTKLSENPLTSLSEELKKENNQEVRYEIALQMVLDTKGPKISHYYEELSLTSAQFFDLLMVEATSYHKTKCEFSDLLFTKLFMPGQEKALEMSLTNEQKFKLAMVYAYNKNNVSLSNWIHLLHLTNNQNYEVAKKATSNSQFYHNFNLFDDFANFQLQPEQKFEIASLFLKDHKLKIIENIDKFGFDSEYKLKFAKAATTLNLSRHLESENKKGKANFINNIDQITRDMDYKSAKEVFKHIALFELDRLPQQERFDFAMNAYWDLEAINYIFSLNLTSEQEWKFAQALAHTGGCGEYIDRFKTLDQIQRFVLAQIQAVPYPKDEFYPNAHHRQHPFTICSSDKHTLGQLSKFIENYALSEEQREVIASLVFSSHRHSFAQEHRDFFANYKLCNLKVIKQLLRNLFALYPDDFVQLLPSYDFDKTLVLEYLLKRYEQRLKRDEPLMSDYSFKIFIGEDNLPLSKKIQRDYPEICLMRIPENRKDIPESVSHLEEDLPLLQPLIQEIKEVKDDFLRNQQLKWLAEIAFFIKASGASSELIQTHLPTFHFINSLRIPEMRLHLTHTLFNQLFFKEKGKLEVEAEILQSSGSFKKTLTTLFTSTIPGWFMSKPKWLQGKVMGYPDTLDKYTINERQSNFDELSALFKDKPHTKLFKVILLPLFEDGNEWNHIIDCLNSSEFKDSGRLRIALSFLKILSETKGLSLEEKKKILDYAFKLPLEGTNKEKIKILCHHFQKLDTAMKLELHDLLKTAKTMQDVDQLLEQKLSEIFAITDIPNLTEQYLALPQRYPDALLIYAGKLKNNSEVKSIFSTCVRAVLKHNGKNEAFHQLRRQYAPESHLDIVFRGREELKDKWQKGETIPFLDLMPHDNEGNQVKAFNVHEYLKARVCDFKHINPEEYPFLDACLKTPETHHAVLEQLTTEQQGLKDNMSAAAPKERGVLGKQIKKLQFQLDLITLLDPDMTAENKLNHLETKILPTLASLNLKDTDFNADLEGLKANFKPVRKSSFHDQWTVADTDDWQDLLLSGTEVIGSCQNINGSGHNVCLTNYIMDDKIRVVVIKNEKGSIVARVVLRILYDETAKKPVLYKEYLYSNAEVASEDAKNVINKMCIRRAESLGLTLTAKGEVGHAYVNPLHSFGSRSPREYVDADRLGATLGVYNISTEGLIVLK